MNDKIGNYIHWNFDNYRKYGLGTKETGHKGGSWSEALNAQRSAMLFEARQRKSEGAKEAIRQELLEKLNFFFAMQGSVVRNKEVYTEKELLEMQNKIVQIINNALSHGNFNIATLTATEDDKLGILSDPLRELKGVQSGWNWYAAIKRRLEIMEKKRNELGDLISSSSSGTKWKNELEDLLKDFKSIENEVLARANIEAGTKISYEEVMANDKLRYQRITGKSDFAARVNNLIAQAKKAANSSLTGEVAELYTTISMSALQKKTKKEVQDLLDNLLNGVVSLESLGWAGKSSSTAIKVTNNFALQGLDKKTRENMGPIFQKIGSNEIKISPTQDKVDVEIILDNDSTLNASIKNYDLSNKTRKIHILNGADILNYVQEYANFVNHYLNMTVEGDTSDSIRNGNLIKAANEVMALTLTVKGLMGGVEKMNADEDYGLSESAEVFIVHDNSKTLGGWNIYFISDIIDKLISVGERIFSYVTIDEFSANTTWRMYWSFSGDSFLSYSAAYQRIVWLLMALSEFKISIEISQQALI